MLRITDQVHPDGNVIASKIPAEKWGLDYILGQGYTTRANVIRTGVTFTRVKS